MQDNLFVVQELKPDPLLFSITLFTRILNAIEQGDAQATKKLLPLVTIGEMLTDREILR